MRPGKKRFIAGAVCPKCKASDSLTIYHVGENIIQECVDCGFTDEMRFDSPSGAMQNHGITDKNQDDSRPVKIVGSKPKSR